MALILAGLFGIFISLVSVALILAPAAAAQAFGIDTSHLADIGLAPLMGARELALGLSITALAVMGKARALGAVLLIGCIVPAADFALAGKAFGYAGAARHLVLLPVFLVLGLVLVRKSS